MGETIQEILDAIDGAVKGEAKKGEHLDLYLFGRSSLVWHYGVRESTKDVDVLRSPDEPAGLMKRAIDLFGRGTAGAERCGVYLDAVNESFPPLPPGYRDRATLTEGPWTVVRVWKLNPHDVIVSKLKRFHAGDREDIAFLCRAENIDPAVIEQRYDAVFGWYYKTEEGDEFQARLDRVLRYVREGVGL